jgi:protein phosphatase 1L
MEDRHVVTTLTVKGKQIPLFAVMDGHGGSATAELIKKHLPDLMTEQLNNFDWETADDLKMHCFWKVVSEDLEELLEKKLQSEYKKDYSGSTLTCSLILNHTLWVLNTGDSRTVLCNNGAARQLSRDACFDDPLFANSIIKHGGKIETANGAKRLWGELGVARSFGDLQYRGIIPIRTLREDGQIHTGMISRFKIKKVEDLESVMEEGKVFLVLATDGLWDRVGSEEAAIFADECEKADEAANKLVKKALKRQSGDNITVVVVYLVAQSAHAEGNQPPGGSQCTPPSQLPTQDLGTPDA